MRRSWLLIPLAILALAVVSFAALRLAFPPSKLRDLVAPRLAAALGRPVELGEVRLGMLPLVVRVERVRLASSSDPASPALLEIGAVELRPRVVPLLARRLAIRSIRIVEPQAWVERRADGTSNWTPHAAGATSARPPASGAAAGERLGLVVEKLVLEGGRIHLADRLLGIEFEAPLAAEIVLRADAALRDVRLSGWVAIDTLHGGPSGRFRGLRGPRLRIEPDLRIDVPESTATIERLRLVVNEAVLDVAGRARRVRGAPDLELSTRAEAIDVAKLLAALPPGIGPAAGLRAAGALRLDLRVAVPAGGAPAARGVVEMSDGSFQMRGVPETLDGVAARLEFAGDSLLVHEIRARVGGDPVRISGLVLAPFVPSRTAFDLRVAAALDLARLARIAPLPAGTALAGRAELDLRARGRAARPDSVHLEGPLALAGVEVRTPFLLQPLGVEARLVGAGTALRVESARLTAGTSRVEVSGTLHPALPPRRPRAVLQGTAKRLDLAALLPAAPAPGVASKTGTSPPSAAAPAQPPLLPVLPPLDYEATLRADEVVLPTGTLAGARLDLRGGPTTCDVVLAARELRAEAAVLQGAAGTLRIENQVGTGRLAAERATLEKLQVTGLQGEVQIRGRRMQLEALGGTAYTGRLTGRAAVDLENAAAPAYDLEFAAEELDANALLGSLTPLRNVVAGTFEMRSGWKYAGTTPQSIRTTLTGGGQASSLEGRIQNLSLLDVLASTLRLPSLANFAYRDLGLQFEVASGRLALREALLHGRDADVAVAGSVGLDGSLDLGLDVALSPELSRRYVEQKTIGALTSLFADPTGRLVFDFRVTGPYRTPKLQADLQKTAARAGVASITEGVLKNLLGKVAQPGAGGISSEAGRRAADEIGRRLGGSLGELLRRDKSSRDDSARADSTR